MQQETCFRNNWSKSSDVDSRRVVPTRAVRWQRCCPYQDLMVSENFFQICSSRLIWASLEVTTKSPAKAQSCQEESWVSSPVTSSTSTWSSAAWARQTPRALEEPSPSSVELFSTSGRPRSSLPTSTERSSTACRRRPSWPWCSDPRWSRSLSSWGKWFWPKKTKGFQNLGRPIKKISGCWNNWDAVKVRVQEAW